MHIGFVQWSLEPRQWHDLHTEFHGCSFGARDLREVRIGEADQFEFQRGKLFEVVILPVDAAYW